LVPWNKVWRTGAGHGTKISFDKDVVLGGQPIKAGQYSIFNFSVDSLADELCVSRAYFFICSYSVFLF